MQVCEHLLDPGGWSISYDLRIKFIGSNYFTQFLHYKGGNGEKNCCYLALYETPQGATNTGSITQFPVVFLSQLIQELPVNQMKKYLYFIKLTL